MLHNCQRIRVYIHNQSKNIAIYVHKILQKHEFSPKANLQQPICQTAKKHDQKTE